MTVCSCAHLCMHLWSPKKDFKGLSLLLCLLLLRKVLFLSGNSNLGWKRIHVTLFPIADVIEWVAIGSHAWGYVHILEIHIWIIMLLPTEPSLKFRVVNVCFRSDVRPYLTLLLFRLTSNFYLTICF